MKIGSLFSGIGGLELGLERAGCGHTVWQCEADPFARRVLAKHWPGVPIFEDVRTMGVDAPIPPVDIICGGFPCQDISNAGRGEGLDGARSGLFFELMRIVRLVRPRYIVLENVSAILVRGGARVLGEVAACGYDGVWDCVPAAAVGAPHRRDRWFFVGWLANPARDGRTEKGAGSGENGQPRARGEVGNTDSARPQGHWREHRLRAFRGALQSRRPSPWELERSVGRAADGLFAGMDRGVMWLTPTRNDEKKANGAWWPTLPGAAGSAPTPEPITRPVESWEGNTPRTVDPATVQDRRNRLRALGNAVVPQVAEVVGRVLMQIHAGRA